MLVESTAWPTRYPPDREAFPVVTDEAPLAADKVTCVIQVKGKALRPSRGRPPALPAPWTGGAHGTVIVRTPSW